MKAQDFLHIAITKVITLSRCNTLHGNGIAESSDTNALVLNRHLSLGMLLLPEPPQTIDLHLVQKKRIYKKTNVSPKLSTSYESDHDLP